MPAAREASSAISAMRSWTAGVTSDRLSSSWARPRIVVRGLLISCATPEASSPTADSFSACTSSEDRRALSSAMAICWAVASSSATSPSSNASSV